MLNTKLIPIHYIRIILNRKPFFSIHIEEEEEKNVQNQKNTCIHIIYV